MVYLACPKDCYDSCSIVASLENGVKIMGNAQHPITAGFLCYKSKFFVSSELGEKRLKRALLREGKRGEGKFREIPLDYALDIISRKLKEVVENCGGKCVLPIEYAGNRSLISYYFPRRFFNYIGSSRLNHSMCDEAGGRALQSIFGTSVGMDPELLKNMKMIIYWGMNPAWTNVHGWRISKLSKAKIYVIDPLKTETAKGADVHIRIKPGSDIFLLFSLLKLIGDRGIKINELEGIVEKFTPEFAGELTGVEPEKIRNFANDLIEKRPFSIHMGYGFQRNINGGLTVKTIAYMLYTLKQERNFIYDAKHIIDYAYLEGKNSRGYIINQANLARELMEKDIRFIFVYNTNPLNSIPNQNLLRKVLMEKDIFIVVHDLFLTDTALFADVVIPATSFLETKDIVDSYYHDYLNLNEGLVLPKGDAISNHDLFVMLAKKMGFKEPSLFEDVDSIINHIIDYSGIDREQFFKKGFARIRRVPNEIKLNMEGFVEELKNFRMPYREGYFRLLSPTSIQGISGQYNNYYEFDDKAHMSTDDAYSLGIKEGEKIRIYNEYGEICTYVKIDPSVGKNIVVIYRGNWPSINGWNVNFLTHDQVQEYAMGTALNSTFVKVEKV